MEPQFGSNPLSCWDHIGGGKTFSAMWTPGIFFLIDVEKNVDGFLISFSIFLFSFLI